MDPYHAPLIRTADPSLQTDFGIREPVRRTAGPWRSGGRRTDPALASGI